MSSQAGRSSSELAGIIYASAKAGLLGLTRQLARQVAPYGILVNAVAPGVILSGERIKKSGGSEATTNGRRCSRRFRWGAWENRKT